MGTAIAVKDTSPLKFISCSQTRRHKWKNNLSIWLAEHSINLVLYNDLVYMDDSIQISTRLGQDATVLDRNSDVGT